MVFYRLQPSTAYCVRVSAFNEYGRSVVSEPYAPSTIGITGPGEHLRAIPLRGVASGARALTARVYNP